MNRCDKTIGWADWTFNPMTGCLYGCEYCYARRIAMRFKGSRAFPNGFEPTWHPERLAEPLHVRKSSRIFVGSMTDMFGSWVEDGHLGAVFCAMYTTAYTYPKHTFFMLTKQPAAMSERLSRLSGFIDAQNYQNVYLGITVTDNTMAKRAQPYLKALHDAGWHTFVSFEPLSSYVDSTYLLDADWFIIGCMTGPGAKKHQPAYVDIRLIVDAADKYGIPVFIKDNCKSVWRIGATDFPATKRQDWPKE